MIRAFVWHVDVLRLIGLGVVLLFVILLAIDKWRTRRRRDKDAQP